MILNRRSLIGGAASVPFLNKQTHALGRSALKAMMPAEPDTLCYPLLNMRMVQEICGNIHESLVVLDWNFRPQPNLARKFTVSPDGLTYTFHLQRGVYWHDGVPFTAQDVVFSCGTILPELNPRSRDAFRHIGAINAPNPYTVIFRLKQPFNAFLLSLVASGAPMMPSHIYKGTNFRTNPFNLRPVGTGPFKFGHWERGQYIQLVRNDDYWQAGYPKISEIYYLLCPTSEQRMVALETGSVDVAFADDIDTVVIKRLMSNPNLIGTTRGYEGVGEITVLEVNQRRWPFSDRRFRQAIMHCLNRDFMVKGINFGLGKVAHGPIPSSAPYYDATSLTRYNYDPARASKLLDEIGLKPGRGGVRFRFGFLMIPDGNNVQTRIAQYVRQAASEVGLDIELQSCDWATYSSRTGNWDFDMDNASYGEYGDPAIGTSRFFVSSNIRKGVPQTNVQGYRNREVDNLFNQAAVALSHAEAQLCYSRLQSILSQDVAMMWLFERNPMLFYNKRVHDLVNGPNGPTDGLGKTWLA